MPTYTPIQSIELTEATSSVTFGGIPQIYQDLVLVINTATTHSSATFPYLRFNSDSATNYSVTELYGTGSTASSARDTNTSRGWIGYNVSISTTIGNSVSTINVMNYSNTTTYKTWIARSNRADSALDYQGANGIAGLYRSTSALTSIQIGNARGGTDYNFAAGSTFDLYGVSPVAADTAQAFGGTEVFYDSSYVYHVFKGSGTFTPYRNLTADILVVAGGGGAGSDYYAGGGGAGGLIAHTSQSLTASTAYTVTIGAGGSTASGNNSQFGSLTAAVGGGKGGQAETAGSNGGSGGGGGGGDGVTFSGGTGTSGQGSSGGSGFNQFSNNGSGGGGGGANAAGSNGAYRAGGNGGAGSSAYSSWGAATNTGQLVSGTYYYAGGGGGTGGFQEPSVPSTGGTGGVGGGGTGGVSPNWAGGVSGTAGTTNTGGGAGGNANPNNGGSGIVIVRYAR